ncbi:hypothetical protein [Xanthomonas vesicatoria]|uniref:Uncharacterized protein n=1 Tax=Xanthomonas vesicatoria TaxID=56460 RepID=A0ABS8LAW4_9XANT|nr:hypothetical protein [Xanthomonas vesicatoria]MCC8596871.1 hypothetical protein [Xanthomonas vesicatoria]MCC8605933.1 hypothetical protein [Xanthomonas vesicatoria]MCC8622889.1 hypothetical protein [Xanthomonas vesicatoria]MCC8629003.1 hypothetical protein [Xanthomonas vesicatoria]MCC8693850.1 hypothetical protein [Xanthomonas vesicatoria]
MAAVIDPIKELDVGGYAEISTRPNPQHLTIEFIPSLAATLLSVETRYGQPLAEAQVNAIRDKATVMVSSEQAAKIAEDRRGYKDINPKHCWQEWQLLRVQLTPRA